MIPVAYKRKEVFYEEITTVPARIRGAFITDDEKKDKVLFHISSMNDTVLYEATNNEHIFDFEITTTGRIKINFTNKYVNRDIKVTFTMTTGQNPILNKESLNFTDSKLDNLIDFINKFGLEFKFSRNSHLEKFNSKMN
jgi:hypothetical protein